MDFMEFPWISWNFHGFRGISMDFIECLRISWNFHGFHWIFMDLIRFLWISWNFNGFHGISMESHGCHRISKACSSEAASKPSFRRRAEMQPGSWDPAAELRSSFGAQIQLWSWDPTLNLRYALGAGSIPGIQIQAGGLGPKQIQSGSSDLNRELRSNIHTMCCELCNM